MKRDKRPAVLTCVAVGAGLLLLYLLPDAIAGEPVTGRADMPVYTWTARRAGELGLSASNTWSRPATIGLLAALASVLGQPVSAVVAVMSAVLPAGVGLAGAVVVQAVFGPDRLRFVLVAVLGGAYVSILALGYLATLTFLALFMVALASLITGFGSERSASWLYAGGLFGAAGLAHPLFSLLAVCLLAGGLIALVPSLKRDLGEGQPLRRSAFFHVLGAAGLGVGVMAAGLGIARAGAGRRLDHSRDALTHRVGMDELVLQSYRGTLGVYLWLVAVWIGAAAGGVRPLWKGRSVLPSQGDRTRFWWGTTIAWLALTFAGVVLLVAGLRVPGQRLVAVCLALPMLAGAGLVELGAKLAGPTRILILSLLAGVLVMFAGLARQVGPPAPLDAISQARTVALAFSETPPGTSLVIQMDDRGQKPGINIVNIANYVRAAVPPRRVEDVYVFVGDLSDFHRVHARRVGNRERDLIALDYARQVRALRNDPVLAVALQWVDPKGFRAALREPGHHLLGDGVVAIPPTGLSEVEPPPTPPFAPNGDDVGPGPLSPGPLLGLGFLVLAVLAVIGWSWAPCVLPSESLLLQVGASPALGVGALALSAMVVDGAGFELGGAGGLLAAGLALVPPAACRLISLRRAKGGGEPIP